jgi:membrane protein
LQVLKRVKTESVADNASLMAGGVAFFALLAIVPLLVAALSIWGLFAGPTDATRLIRDIATGLSHSAQRLIMQQLRSITRRSNGGLSITAAISLLIAL